MQKKQRGRMAATSEEILYRATTGATGTSEGGITVLVMVLIAIYFMWDFFF